jgi:hypothetical protein
MKMERGAKRDAPTAEPRSGHAHSGPGRTGAALGGLQGLEDAKLNISIRSPIAGLLVGT